MISYPTFLPGPLLSGYALNQQSNLLRSELDSGQARVRRRFKNVPSIIASTWTFTAEQSAFFEEFIETTLGGGVEWFEMQIKSPLGIRTELVRFIENPMEACTTLSPTRWQYKATIELKKRNTLSTVPAGDPSLDYLVKFVSDTDMSRYYN